MIKNKNTDGWKTSFMNNIYYTTVIYIDRDSTSIKLRLLLLKHFNCNLLENYVDFSYTEIKDFFYLHTLHITF